MTPVTRTERPAQAAYREHIAVCEAVQIGLWCCVCSALDATASVESGQGPRGFAPDPREWRPEAW